MRLKDGSQDLGWKGLRRPWEPALRPASWPGRGSDTRWNQRSGLHPGLEHGLRRPPEPALRLRRPWEPALRPASWAGTWAQTPLGTSTQAQTPPGASAQACTLLLLPVSKPSSRKQPLDQLPFSLLHTTSALPETDRIALAKHWLKRCSRKTSIGLAGASDDPSVGLGPLKQMALELNTLPGHQDASLKYKHGSSLSRTPLEFRWQRYVENARTLLSGGW